MHCIFLSLSLLNWNVVDYAANKILRKPTSNGWELRCVHVLKISCRYFWNWAAAAADGGDGGGVATVLAVLEIGFSQANKTSDVPVAGAKNVFITFRARVFCATRKILEATTTTTTRGAGAGAVAVMQEQRRRGRSSYSQVKINIKQQQRRLAKERGMIPGAATPTPTLHQCLLPALATSPSSPAWQSHSHTMPRASKRIHKWSFALNWFRKG